MIRPLNRLLFSRCYSSGKIYTTRELVDLSNRYLLGVYNKPPMILHRGDGAIVEDMDGNKFLDMTAGIAVTSLGHGNSDLAEILKEQASKIISTSNLFHNEHAGPLAEQLVNTTSHPSGGEPWAHQVFFTNSGTEANEAALKFARKVGFLTGKTNKYGFVNFEHAFHGRTLGTLSVTPKPAYQTPFEPLLPGIVTLNFNCSRSDIETMVTETTCGVIVEPIQGEGGVHVANHNFLEDLRHRCNHVGAVLIYDEIQCGLGRTGQVWAHQHFPASIVPDILTMAKPLGNGFPIGAVLVNEKVSSALKVGDHGTTFGGNPLACAVARCSLTRLTASETIEHVNKVSDFIKTSLANFVHPAITEIRGKGLIIGVQFDSKQLLASKVCEQARQRQMLLITCGDNAVRLVPSLVLTMEQAEAAMNIFQESVDAAYNESS